MKRYSSALLVLSAGALACVGVSDSGPTQLFVVSPVLDSVYVGDTLPARSVYLVDAAGHQSNPGPYTWSITPTSVATVDPATGKIVGRSKGTALLVATRPDSVKSGAVVSVSPPLDLTLEMDTIVLMASDTITVPLAIKQKIPGVTTIQFDPSPDPTVYTITDSTITAVGSGGPVRYVARLHAGTDSVVDTGAVVVVTLTDTAETGRSFMTLFGTAVRHQRGTPIARNYRRLNFKLAFQLADTVYETPVSGAIHERVLITLPDSVLGPGTFEIDSISPQQANTQISQLNPYCQPKFPWALWYSILPAPQIYSYSHGTGSDSVAGRLTITQFVPAVVSGGTIISGRYQFTARRTDLYDDPLGSETVRGTFVAPLWTDGTTCGN
jgi:hypothetical protein